MLKNNNLSLRAMEPTDIDIVFQWENNTENWKVSNTITPFSKYAIKQFIKNSNNDIYTEKQLRLMIEWKEENVKKAVGCIDLFEFSPKNSRLGVGILVDKEYRKRGIADVALDILINYVFQNLNIHQIYCNILSNNKESIALFEKKGFVEIGEKKDWLYFEGEYYHEKMYQLIK